MNIIEKDINMEIINVAILNSKAIGEDLIEPYIPFVSTLISKKQYESFTIEEICADFKKEYSFYIPAMPMTEILNRMAKRNILKKDGRGNIYPNYSKIEETDFNEVVQENIIKYKNIINKYIEFAKQKYNFEISEEIANNNLSNFIKENYINALVDDNYIKKIDYSTDENESKDDIYILNKFILHLNEYEYELFKTIKNYCLGYTISNALSFDNLSPNRSNFRDKKIYFDTKFILRLLGIEGEFYKKSYEAIIQVLKENNCKLYIFGHTYDEILSIFESAKISIRKNKQFDDNVPEVQKFFMKSNYTEGDILLYKSKLKKNLNNLGIIMDNEGYTKYTDLYQVDPILLHQNIIDVYKKKNPYFDEESKKETISKDERSIELIYRKMRGSRSRSLDTSIYLFVTTNKSLAFACKNFDKNLGKKEAIAPCITDIFLGTLLWYQNPVRYDKIKENQILASCYASVQLTTVAINKFLKEAENLKEKKQITKGDYILLKDNAVIEDMLSDKIIGNIDNITEDTTMELIEQYKKEIRREPEQELLKKEEEIKQKNKKIEEITKEKEQQEKRGNSIEDVLRNELKRLARFKAILKIIYKNLLPMIITSFVELLNITDAIKESNFVFRIIINLAGAAISIIPFFVTAKKFKDIKEEEYVKLCNNKNVSP